MEASMLMLTAVALCCLAQVAYTVLSLRGMQARLGRTATAAFQLNRVQTQGMLSQQAVALIQLVKKCQRSAARGWRCSNRHQQVQHNQKLKKLQKQVLRQNRQMQEHRYQQAQRMQQLEQNAYSAGVELFNRLTQIARDMRDGQLQVTELRSQVRASARAQDLLQGLASVITDVRSQLQVSLDAQATLKVQLQDMDVLKEQVRNSNSNRQQLQQQAALIAELRGELRASMDSQQELKAQAASLENLHAARSQSLHESRSQSLHGFRSQSLRAPDRSVARMPSRLSITQQISYMPIISDSSAPLPLKLPTRPQERVPILAAGISMSGHNASTPDRVENYVAAMHAKSPKFKSSPFQGPATQQKDTGKKDGSPSKVKDWLTASACISMPGTPSLPQSSHTENETEIQIKANPAYPSFAPQLFASQASNARESPFAAHARKFTPESTPLSQLRTHSLPMLSHGSSALKPLSANQLAPFSQPKPSSNESASHDGSEQQGWSLEAATNSARISEGTTIVDAGSKAEAWEGSDSSSKPLGYYPAKPDRDADANARPQTVPEELSDGSVLLPAAANQTSPAKETAERAKSPPRTSEDAQPKSLLSHMSSTSRKGLRELVRSFQKN